VADRTGIALLPTGPSGRRAVYAGCHSFAIPRLARNRQGAARLLHDLTSTDAQLQEARGGAIPARLSALASIRAEASVDPQEQRRWELLTESQEAMIIPPRFATYPACEDVLWRTIQRAIEGEISAQHAVTEGARQIAALVDRTRPSVPNVV
jgi:multiple sugar transport system substrate-binding protein